MFEDRTYENIMAEMMAEMPDDINTEEGSLIFNACVKQALKLEEAYLSMAYVYDNMLPDTQDEEHLIRYALERGVQIKEATKAILLGEFMQEIDIGTRFTLNDMDYVAIERIEDYKYKLECEEEGIVGNTSFGEIDPVDYVEDWQGGSITKVLIPGQNQEDIEVFRKRVFDTFSTKAFGGNKEEYLQYFHELDGIGGVKVRRRATDGVFIYAYIIDSDFNVPSEKMVKEVQSGIDPETSHGEGEGFAPIGHQVQVIPVNGIPINIETSITFDTGYTYADMESYIFREIDTYFKELASTWESVPMLTVRISQLESKILSIKGVIDISDTKLNGKESNVILGEFDIPVRGNVHVI